MPDSSTAPLLTEPSGSGAIYLVSAGDNLTSIVRRHAQMTLRNPEEAIKIVMEDNPHIKNANLIFPGQPIFLRSRRAVDKPLPQSTAADVRQAMTTLTSHRSQELSALAKHEDLIQLILGTSSGLSSQFGTVVKSNQKALKDLISQHKAYRAGGVSPSGYKAFNSSRANVLQKIQTDFGRSAKPLLGGTAKQVTTLNPGRSLNPTSRLSTSAARLSKISGVMKGGGVVLQAAGVAVTAEVTRQNVCAADSRIEKNQHLVGGGGSIVGGLALSAAGGIAVTVALGSNPVGWAVLLVIGASAAGGYLGSKGGQAAAKKVYNEYGNGYDLVEMSGIESLCP